MILAVELTITSPSPRAVNRCRYMLHIHTTGHALLGQGATLRESDK